MSSVFPPDNGERPLVAISSCLLGERVRYDGGHRKSAAVSECLATRVRWMPLCPEVELGLPVPRPPLRLAHDERGTLQLLTTEGEELTTRMRALARQRIAELREAGIKALIVKSRSPTCSASTASVFGRRDGIGSIVERGAGLFVRELRAVWPELPVVEDTELCSKAACACLLHLLLSPPR